MRLLVASLVALTLAAGCVQPEPSAGPTATIVPTVTEAPPAEPVPTLPAWPHFPNDGSMAVANGSLLVANPFHPEDAHVVPYTLFRPVVADAAHKVPVLVHSHGFGGRRASAATPEIEAYVAAGFAVVSYDQRGHGDARARVDQPPVPLPPGTPVAPAGPGNGSDVVRFMHPEYEVVDLSALLDEVATWDWVLLDGPGDPRVGGIGYSYGGAFQLMGAILDGRLDALVPEITWNDIVDSLAPNGAIKSAWVDGFYLQGNAPTDPQASANPTSPRFGDLQPRVTFSQEFHAGFAWTMATNTMPQGQAPGVPDLVGELRRSSPASYPWRLDVPTFLIQGMPDTLFNLNQAVANVELLKATGAEWALHTHLGGHVFNTDGDLPDAPVAIGLQGVAGEGRPCGDQTNLTIAWHQRHLLGLDVPFGPKVCIALEDGRVAVGDDYPLPGTTTLRLEGLQCSGGAPCALAQGGGTGSFVVLDLELEPGMVLAGIPHLEAKVTSPGADAIVFASLQRIGASGDGPYEAIVDDQVTAVRLGGPNSAPLDLRVPLGGIGTAVGAEDRVVLVLSGTSGIHIANANRVPGFVLFEDVTLALPVVPAELVRDAFA